MAIELSGFGALRVDQQTPAADVGAQDRRVPQLTVRCRIPQLELVRKLGAESQRVTKEEV